MNSIEEIEDQIEKSLDSFVKNMDAAVSILKT